MKLLITEWDGDENYLYCTGRYNDYLKQITIITSFLSKFIISRLTEIVLVVVHEFVHWFLHRVFSEQKLYPRKIEFLGTIHLSSETFASDVFDRAWGKILGRIHSSAFWVERQKLICDLCLTSDGYDKYQGLVFNSFHQLLKHKKLQHGKGKGLDSYYEIQFLIIQSEILKNITNPVRR